MNVQNPDCDGAHCQYPRGLVKRYDLGDGAWIILCFACWVKENNRRRTFAPDLDRHAWQPPFEEGSR